MRCSKILVQLAPLTCLAFMVSPAFGCGTMPPGQARRISFNVAGFTLPVNMVWSTPTEAVKAPGISGSAMEVQSIVQRVIMQAAIDVLEEQGRRDGLFPAVISGILDQLTVNTSYNPLQCTQVNVNPTVAAQTMIINGGCIVIGTTVTSVCIMAAAAGGGPGVAAPAMCMYNPPFTGITPVSEIHRTISGTISTTNIIMANWTTQMWQSVMNRVARSLATKPFGSNFIGVSATLGS
ncbi:hypothetical protein KIN20_004252 [Parelaphostrongylus tenuis]|uniref:Uncharacterized protein n=1 Tax=Parelaphostrongylus tenuis TaxID=148309 RepID=A0AAD5MJN8_PARTN|nr:hypothetical protein KIN20_004252 [Parelaphostrongylus tenuis]